MLIQLNQLVLPPVFLNMIAFVSQARRLSKHKHDHDPRRRQAEVSFFVFQHLPPFLTFSSSFSIFIKNHIPLFSLLSFPCEDGRDVRTHLAR